jgi:hypothetical protein
MEPTKEQLPQPQQEPASSTPMDRTWPRRNALALVAVASLATLALGIAWGRSSVVTVPSTLTGELTALSASGKKACVTPQSQGEPDFCSILFVPPDVPEPKQGDTVTVELLPSPQGIVMVLSAHTGP